MYYLEDRSYLDPVTKNGKYDFDKYANQNEVYAAENETLVKIARFLGLKPKALSHGYSTIYVNEKTHTFLPGEVNIFYDHYNEDFEYDEEDAKDTFGETIDCTPKDTKGYKLIVLSEYDAIQYDGYMNPALTDINNAESITNDSSEDINFDDTASVMNWEILTVSAEDFSNKACFKALPLTTALILIVACLVALLLAITVSTDHLQQQEDCLGDLRIQKEDDRRNGSRPQDASGGNVRIRREPGVRHRSGEARILLFQGP